MRGVGVTLMLAAEATHPTFGPVAVVFVAEVVDIGPFEVGESTEHSLLFHGEHGLMEGVIAAVLKHEAVSASTLGSVDKLPALCNRRGCGYLNGYVLTLLHGIAGHRGVGEPVGTYVYKIDIVSLA